jgi:flagellin
VCKPRRNAGATPRVNDSWEVPTMPMKINTNIISLNAQRNLNASQSSLATSMQRLSSGLRVNSAKDDAAGLAIAERMDTQVRGMNVAIRNANDGISLGQTADGALAAIGSSLQRMRELAVQSRNSTNSASDKDSLNLEFQQLGSEITRVLGGTTFNGQAILASAGTLTFQVGANTSANDSIGINTTDLTQDPTLTAVTGATIDSSVAAGTSRTNAPPAASDATGLAKVIDDLDSAINTVNSQRAIFGAAQNRFSAVITNLQTSVENQSAARSRIMDADFAAETASMSRAQILQQAGTAMVAQANALPQQVLKLLQG